MGWTARLSLCAALAATAGCATPGPRPAWYLNSSGTPSLPMALYSLPESEAFLVLECVPAERAIAFRTIDVEPFEGTRPIVIRVGRARFDGSARFETGDMPASRALIPVDSPVAHALAMGRGPIAVTTNGATGRIPTAHEVVMLAQECRARVLGPG